MGLKPHLYSITSVTSLPNISAIRLGPRPTNCCGLGSVLGFRVLGVGFCIYSSSNTKAQILALRFPISHAKAHISLKSRQLRGKALPTSLNSEMEFRKVSQEFRALGLKPHLYLIIPITPMLNLVEKTRSRVPRFGLRPSMLKPRSSRSEFRC